MKSKLEIIQETAEFYNLDNRSSYNAYIGPEGKHCAFSRCCDLEDTAKFEYLKKNNVHIGCDVILNSHFGQQILKPEYRGYEVEFWRDIQELHDFSSNWTETGLSKVGEKRVEDLINKWS